jgi:hypothetical protein
LLPDNLNHRRVAIFRKLIHGLGPKGDCNSDQENAFDHSDGAFDVVGGMAAHTKIIRFRIARAAEPQKRIGEVGEPADKQHNHQPVHVDDKRIDLPTMLGCEHRQAEEIAEEFLHR